MVVNRPITMGSGSGYRPPSGANRKPTAQSSSRPSSQSRPQSSVGNVSVSSQQQQSIKDQMAANSQAWHEADEEGKKKLEQANKDLAAQLGGLTFDKGTGQWSGQAGSSGGASSRPTGGGSSGGVSSRPAGGGSSGGSTLPQNFQGSASGVQVNTVGQEAIRQEMNANSKEWHTADEERKKQLEARNQYLASILNAGGGSVSFDPGSGKWSGSAGGQMQLPQQIPGQLPHKDMEQLHALLEEWKNAAQAQNQGKIDYETQKAILELERILADSQAKYQAQAAQVARDEMQSRDNSALYAEMRGDKGGIGEEQYSSIMNTAAQNRLAVQQAQTKLATDTNRQIADLRAQGEFAKADAALELAQTYLSQLINLEQWAAEYNLSVDQFNESVRQWEAEFHKQMEQFQSNKDLAWAELMGQYQGKPTLSAQKYAESQLIASGQSLLSYGIMPSDEQLKAMGMTREQAGQLIAAAQLEMAAKAEAEKNKVSGGGKGSGGSGNAGGGATGKTDVYQKIFDKGYTDKQEDEIVVFLMEQGMKESVANNYAKAYVSTKYKAMKKADEGISGDRFNAMMRTIIMMMDQGKTDALISGIDAVWPEMSRDQQKQLQNLLGRYGYTYGE